MPVKRITLFCAALALAVVAGLAAQDVRNDPGPLEKRANPITPENPVPRRTSSVAPAYPAEASAVNGSAIVSFRVTLDEAGRVAEIRQTNNPVVAVPATTPRNPAALASAADALSRSAVAALQRWTYDAPAKGPITFGVTFSFRPGVEPTMTHDTALRPLPPPPPPGARRRSWRNSRQCGGRTLSTGPRRRQHPSAGASQARQPGLPTGGPGRAGAGGRDPRSGDRRGWTSRQRARPPLDSLARPGGDRRRPTVGVHAHAAEWRAGAGDHDRDGPVHAGPATTTTTAAAPVGGSGE